MTIRRLERADWPAVRAIYAAGIATGNATFELEPPTEDRFFATHSVDLSLVADADGQVAGWVAAAPASDRQAYAGVIEHSVYVDPARQGQGLGRALLEALIDQAESRGIWTIQSGVFPENLASVRLHESVGFRIVGCRRRIGQHHGRWRDVLAIERRSSIVGVD